MAYRGAGAPPPKTGGGGFKNTKPTYHLAEKVTGKNGAELKLVRGLKIQVEEKDRPVVTLDNIKSLDDAYTTNLHIFNLRDTKDNMVVCPKTEADPRPCPICTVFNKAPTWFVCLTCVDQSKWSPSEGKNKGVVYTNNRRLVLISNPRKPTMQLYIDKATQVRGAKFTISRSKPSKEIGRDGQEYLSYKNSPRIGDLWFPSGLMTEELLKKEFEEAASKYGLSVEKFVQPFDYEFLLKPKDHKQLLAIANDIKDDPSSLKDQASKGSDDEDASDTAVAPAANAEAEIKY
jgi:hypothetical protein